MKPPRSSRPSSQPRVAAAPPPPPRPPVRHVAIPEIDTLRELRRALARGGLSAVDMRTPEDCARIASLYVILDLLRLLDEFKRRVEGGERCRLVVVERNAEAGRLAIRIAIEAQP